MRGQKSPKFALGRGRGASSNRDESIGETSGGFTHEGDLSANFDKYKTITVREDDEFYKAYIEMKSGANQKKPLKNFTDRRWESDRKAIPANDSGFTSRFGDSEKG